MDDHEGAGGEDDTAEPESEDVDQVGIERGLEFWKGFGHGLAGVSGLEESVDTIGGASAIADDIEDGAGAADEFAAGEHAFLLGHEIFVDLDTAGGSAGEVAEEVIFVERDGFEAEGGKDPIGGDFEFGACDRGEGGAVGGVGGAGLGADELDTGDVVPIRGGEDGDWGGGEFEAGAFLEGVAVFGGVTGEVLF